MSESGTNRRSGPGRWRRWVGHVFMASAWTVSILITGLTIAWIAFPLPEDILHPGPGGGMVLDDRGSTLVSVVAADDQRRLPVGIDQVGRIIPEAVVAVEDHAFHDHIGIDPGAVVGATLDNLAAGRVVRGASTITMQVAGLKLGHPRTFSGKAAEGFRSLQIEFAHSKEQILEAWLNLAPFGGNIVGIEAASRSWLGKSARDCSVAEAALLVGIPNAPERFRPDRHPGAAMERRRVVLNRMHEHGLIDAETRDRAAMEPVVVRRLPDGVNRRHVGWMAIDAEGRGRVIETTVNRELQTIAESIVDRHSERMPVDADISLVLVDHGTSEILALVGSSDPGDPHDGAINGATALRSPGSALKPFLYAEAFQRRRLAPDSIVDDSAIDLDGWRPRNIDRRTLGPMPAAEALRSSRNLPAIRLAGDLGAASVTATLRRCGIDLPIGSAERAGLSIAVGGVEVRPIELAEAYATLARGGVHRDLVLIRGTDVGSPGTRVFDETTCAAIEWCLAGPETDVSKALPFIAAKTGTSSGLRDALAAGWNRRFTAVVWVGRFDGASDPAFLGADAALPILEDLLGHPTLATPRSSRPWSAWKVDPAVAMGRAGPPRTPAIIHPEDGAVLPAAAEICMLTTKVRGGDDCRLLLDGRPVERGEIEIEPGVHELRVVEPGRPPHAVRFTVVRNHRSRMESSVDQ
ncbi:MAG: hypothetical protein CMJ34_15295 [Phycisphaerae bacterium]|nr:hypothetical protein [Phycisphaerae bacterium]